MWISKDNRGSSAAALQSTCARRAAWAGHDRLLPPTIPRMEVLEVEEVEEEEVAEEERETTWSYLVGQLVSNPQIPPPKEEAWAWGLRTYLSTSP